MNSDKIAYRLQVALTEAVIAGEIALDDANSFLSEAEGMLHIPLGEIDEEREVSMSGRITFEFHTNLTVPMESREDIEGDMVAELFERIMSGRAKRDDYMSIEDVQIDDCRING